MIRPESPAGDILSAASDERINSAGQTLTGVDNNAGASISNATLIQKVNELEARIIMYEAHNTFLREENNLLRQQLATCATDGGNDSSSPSSGRVRPRKQAKRTECTSEPEALGEKEDLPCPSITRDPRQRATGTPIYNATGNRFAALADAATNRNQTTASTAAPNRANAPAASSAASRSRKKVIQAINVDLFSIRQHLTNANVNNFAVKQSSVKGPVKITINSESEVQAAKTVLANNRVSYHEYKWADEKRKCFIIRGLVGTKEEHLPDIKDDLIAAGLPVDIVVSLHSTGFMRANPSAEFNAPVKMVVPPNFDDKILLGIKHLNHIAVRFERFKSHSVVQCKNCQRFGHSASGCMHEHRCVKCGVNHLREDCPRTHSANHKLRCCNCGGEHTANNLNSCPYFQNNFAKKIKPIAATSSVSSAPSARVQPGVSFAQIAGSSRQTNPVKRPSLNSVRNINVSDNQTHVSETPQEITISLDKILDYFDSRFELVNQRFERHDRLLQLLSDKLLNE